jgi:hypothetical protein
MPGYYSITDFTGGIDPLNAENPARFLRNNRVPAIDIENFMPTSTGYQRKTTGFKQIAIVNQGVVTNFHRFTQFGGTSLLLASIGNKLYKWTDSTLTDLGLELDPANIPHFETAYNMCVICDGTQTLRLFDGIAFTSVISGSTNILLGSIQSLFYQNRLWVFGNPQNQSILYYSNPNDIANGYAQQFVNCDINDGQAITGISQLFIPGQLEPVILVAKTHSIGIVTGDGSLNNPYTFSKINQTLGVHHFTHVLGISQSVILLTDKGVYQCHSDIQNLNLSFSILSEAVNENLLNASQTNTAMFRVFHDWSRHRVSFSVAEKGYPYPNLLYHYDLRFKCWYKERWFPGQYGCAHYIDTDGTWRHGDDVGGVFTHGNELDFNSKPITCIYKTPFVGFANPNKTTQLLALGLRLKSNGQFPLLVSMGFDYGARPGPTYTIDRASSNYHWNNGVWTTDNEVYQWSENTVSMTHLYPSGVFKQLQLTLSQSGVNQSLELQALFFNVR